MNEVKDIQDEAERLAKEYAKRGLVKSNHPHDAQSFLDGFYAGMASKEAEIEHFRQAEKVALLHFKSAEKEIERLKLDYTNLKKSHDERNLFLDKVKILKQLGAEKSRSASLLASIKRIADVAVEHDTGERQDKMTDWEYVFKESIKAIAITKESV